MISNNTSVLVVSSTLSLLTKHKYNSIALNKAVFSFGPVTASRKMSQQSVKDKFRLPNRLQANKKSMWNEYIELAIKYKPLNLGQGFCDYAVPKYVTDAFTAVGSGNHLLHQYTRGFGHIRLVQAISKLYSSLVNRPIDFQNEVLISAGAYSALYSAIQGHVDVGDEVIIVEPFFEYEPIVRMAGGVPQFIPLKPKNDSVNSTADWLLDVDELENIFSNKTKMFILNNPNNPLGKVFTAKELQKIADLCIKFNVLCLADEVYEWITYDDNKMIRMCTLDGMWERTITIGSAGKTFSTTGWKIGWAFGPANLMANLQMVHQNSIYTCSTPTQEALAIAFETELDRLDTKDCYFNALPQELQKKRDFMAKFLKHVGMNVTIPQGGYFFMADWSPLADKCDLTTETDTQRDYRFTKWMVKNLGLQGIPPSAFYSSDHKHLGENYVRYCFFKDDDYLKKCADLLAKWKLYQYNADAIEQLSKLVH